MGEKPGEQGDDIGVIDRATALYRAGAGQRDPRAIQSPRIVDDGAGQKAWPQAAPLWRRLFR